MTNRRSNSWNCHFNNRIKAEAEAEKLDVRPSVVIGALVVVGILFFVSLFY